MSLLWADGFDHYTTNEGVKKWWDAGGNAMNIVATGRYGVGKFLQFNNNGEAATKVFSSTKATLIFGAAISCGWIFNGYTILSFLDGATEQLGLRYEDDNVAVSRIQVVRGDGTVLATSTNKISSGVWYFIELKVTFHNSSGSFELRVNGVTECSGSGVDTCNTANNYADRFRVRGSKSFGNYYQGWDDLYVCDDAGSRLNDFLGEISILTSVPNAAGTTTQFTPSAGSNYQNVDDSGDIDDDTTYNKSQTVGHIDLYNFPDWATDRTILAVQAVTTLRKDDTGIRRVKPLCRSGGTNYQGSEINLTTTYLMYVNLLAEDPNTSLQWLVANLNSAEFGLEVTV